MKYLAVIGIMVAITLIGGGAANRSTLEKSLEKEIRKDLDQLLQQWEGFKSVQQQDPAERAARYQQLKRAYKTVEGFLAILLNTDELAQLNNSVHWVRRDAIYDARYPEAGALQLIERSLGGPVDTIGIQRIDSLLARTVGALEVGIDHWPKDWLFSLLLDQYRQYFLTLSGFDRLDPTEVISDYRAALRSHIRYLEWFGPEMTDAKAWNQALDQLRDLYAALEGTEFDQLDRAALLRDTLQPVWTSLQQLALQRFGAEIPAWTRTLNWKGASPFAENWLNRQEFLSDMPAGVELKDLEGLGELLFYDPILSGNNKRTCASCHKPQKAFSDGRSTSRGFDFSAGLERNAPSLINSVFNRYYKYDNSLASIQEQILSVVYHPQEFRTSMAEILAKLNTSESYRALFADCFSTAGGIDSNQVVTALTAYNGSLVSFGSPLDHYFRDRDTTLNPKAVAGYNLFMGKAMCGSCHFAPLFSGLQPPFFRRQEYHSHGIHLGVKWADLRDGDPGLEAHPPFAALAQDYRYYYKTPSLRNLAATAPYMHNGLFNDIRETLAYLFDPSRPHAANADFPPGALNLSNDEQEAIAAFLESLNDREVLRAYSEDILLPETDGTLAPAQRKAAGVY
ncbi:cytochrome-c peroxidase [Flavilitoribacter nigricans]|uniref:Cytochrome c domain-containing protein n=1 Tax=Flavilitoribacter nigricans (strain ATCC 23147 / DSM 23189 / NBRC 102662 / NCIMB 1420 / SS-2) TaxID=1122177 RepID=A0A2D0MYI8_FLAN2|nr:cytochrome c peroxidase [Flavilitoribacter nigricans]PHN01240.1 hypothetical protein CRP01_38185 [Flavilitoribacter nigricans DSM 23189 = NBRC 102662]